MRISRIAHGIFAASGFIMAGFLGVNGIVRAQTIGVDDVIIPPAMRKAWEPSTETFISLIASGHLLRAVETSTGTRVYYMQKADGGPVFYCTHSFCIVTKKP